MFESILFRPNSSRKYPIDYGQLIESLFFYQKTILHIGRGEIRSLYDLTDVDVLVELFKNPTLSVYYNNSHVGVVNDQNIRTVDSFGLADLDLEKELFTESYAYKGDKKRSQIFAHKLSRLIPIHSLPKEFNSELNTQLKDDDFRNNILKQIIKYYQPNLNFEDIRYELEFLDVNSFKIHSNFEQIGIDSKLLTVDSPILALVNACEDLLVAGENNSEILLPEYNSIMAQVKVNKIIQKTVKSQEEIQAFNHYAYNESWALREAINSKRLHIKAILPTLRNASRYKEWLEDLPNDGNLLREYIAKVEEKSILEKLPSKAIRFYIYNGLSILLSQLDQNVGITTAIGLNAFDTFLFEKLLNQWKPNQFVEKELIPLINENPH